MTLTLSLNWVLKGLDALASLLGLPRAVGFLRPLPHIRNVLI